MSFVRAAIALVAMLVAPLLSAQYAATFEEPTFSLGDVNGQDGWGHLDNSPTGGAIEAVPAGSPGSFGAQSLAIRTRNSQNFGVANRLYSATIDPAGETGSTVGGVVVPSPESTFLASFWYHTPATPLISSRPDGRFAELDPSSKGSGEGAVANRYAQVRVFNTTNTAAGSPRVEMRWFLGSGSLTAVDVATLEWDEWYRFEYTIALVDGLDGDEANDRFTLRIYDVDDNEIGSGCGSTWELGWKSGTFGGGATARAINGFDFWSMSGPDTTVVGHLDNLMMTSTTPAAGPLAVTIGGSSNTCDGATVPLTANDSGGSGTISSYTWRDSSNDVVGTGSAFAAGAGTYTVTITDSLCESAVSAEFTVTAYAPLAVTVSGDTNVCYGGTTTLTANASGGSGSFGSYSWRDSNAMVVGSGTTLEAGAGTYTVTVNDATCGLATSNEVTVQTTCKATPVVTWSNPADITYGTALDATQLNATANVAGTFTYTPAAGTVLNAGPNQVLSVDFTPTDSTNYEAVNGTTVEITVNKAPTTTTVTTITPSPSEPGQPVTLGFALDGIIGTPAGTVTITDGVDSCSAPATSSGCTIAFATSGTRTLTATYSGDANHLGSASAGRTHMVAEALPTSVLTGSAEICAGATTILRVQLTGDGPWTITWSDDVVERASSGLHERTVMPSATTSYRILSVRDRNGFGEHSGVAVVTVNAVPPPSIVDAPRPKVGQPATLRATPGYTSYQWFRNGAAIPGATADTLTIDPFTRGDAGNYRVTGSRDGCVSAASAPYSLVPVDVPVEDAVIPVVGMTHGFGGSLFRTTVTLVNAAEETMEGELTFIDGSLPPYPYMLGPGETRFIEDLLPPAFNGLTSANLRRLRGPLPVAIAHVFNDGADLGTSGLIERAIPSGDFLNPGDRAVLITPIDPVTTRFNVGLRSMSEGLAVRVTRRTAAGALLGTINRTLPPSTLVHEAAATFLGAAIGSSESLTFEILAGSGVIYGAATDNGTNDPNMQIARKLVDVVRSGRYVLPVAGAINGLFDSRFATGLQLHNPTDHPFDATLTFHPGGVSGSHTDPHLDVTVPAYGTAALDDVVAAMLTTGLGSLDVVTPHTVDAVLLARVYSIADIGQTSMMTELILAEEALRSGEEGVIAAPHAPDESRFNIGIRTISDGAHLTATVRNKSGDVVRVVSRTFPATYFVQTDAASLLGVPFTGDESVRFTMHGGNAVIYGVWTDNVTQDPAMQYAARP